MEGPIRMTMTDPPLAPPNPGVADAGFDAPDPSVAPAHRVNTDNDLDNASASGATPTWLELLAIAAIVVGMVLPAVLWGRIFADEGHVPAIAVASVGGGAVAMVMHFLRRQPAMSFISALITLVIGLSAWYNTALADLPSDLIDSWKALASTGLLIATSRSFLIPPIVVTALCSWAAVSVLLRRRAAILVALPLFTASAVALAYTVSLGDVGSRYVAALVAVLGICLLAGGIHSPGGERFDAETPRLPIRQLVAGVAVVAGLAAAAGGLTSLLGGTGDDALDLRAELARPLDIFESATPLANVKAGLVADVPNSVFTITLDGLSAEDEVTLLPVAALDRYDGSIWSTTAQFEPAGARLPVPEQVVSIGSGGIRQQVELDSGYPFRFLPRAGVVRELSGEGLAWDPRSGTVAGVADDLSGYTAAIDLTAPPLDPLPDPGELPGSIRYAAERPETTEGQAEVLAEYAASVTSATESLEARLAQFEADLRSEGFGYNEEAPAGHSLAALTSYLRPEPVDPGSDADAGSTVPQRIGFSEQSASVFAVLAREMGLASRVVVGYRLDEPLTAAAPEQTVDEGQIHAWPEVWFDGIGWVGFDPTNSSNRSDDLSARTPAVSSSGQGASEGDLPDLAEPVLLPPEEPVSERSALWWLLLIPVLPFLYALIVAAAKRLRRTRRRRATDADRQVIGSWREVRDRFTELGLPAPASSSALDLAEHLDVIDLRDLAAPVGELAPVIDDALYAPTPVSAARAGEAWALADAAISRARKQVGFKQRFRATLDPRTLLR